jgi:hypothetical protein
MSLAALTSAIGVALCYGASRHQRWFARPLPAAAAYIAACLTSFAALALWSLELGTAVGITAWIVTTSLSAITLVATGAVRRT